MRCGAPTCFGAIYTANHVLVDFSLEIEICFPMLVVFFRLSPIVILGVLRQSHGKKQHVFGRVPEGISHGGKCFYG